MRLLRGLGLATLALGAMVPTLGCSGGGVDDVTHIDYLLPEELPEGWTLRVATERPGRPEEDWVDGEPYFDDVADYTISWAPASQVGTSRRASVDLPEPDPRLYLNVGAGFFLPVWEQGHEGRDLPASIDDAIVEQDADGELSLDFSRDGVLVKVGGHGVEEAVLRDLAKSLRAMPRDAWRERLGDRLLVDEPEQR